MNDDRRHELRDHLIAALMEHEHRDFADAERVVAEFERICRNCGSPIDDDSCLTIWGQLDSR